MSAELYLNVLTEAAHTASIIPFGSEPTLAAMKAFGGYSLPLAAISATIGATIGQAFNWGIGRVMLILKEKQRIPIMEERFQYASVFFKKYGIFVLLFSWMNLFNFVTVAAGFFGVKPKIAFPLLCVGLAGHYGYYLFR